MAANETDDDLELWLRIVHGTVGTLLFLCSIIGSCTVLLLVSCNRKLRRSSIVISLGLVAADLVLAAAWLFQVLAYASGGKWTFEDRGYVCTAFGVVLVWLLYVRWSEVAVVTADRFLVVIFPFFTYQRCSKPLIVTMTILAWVVPAGLVLPSVAGFGRLLFRPQISACTVDCEGDEPCTTFYTVLFGVFLLIGGVLPALLYTTMYCIGLRKRWRYKNRRLGTVGTSSPQEPVSSSSSSGNAAEVENTDSPTHDTAQTVPREHVSRKLSRTFRLFKPQDRRALVTIFIIFLSMLITHIPIYLFSAIRSVGNIYESTPLIVHFISVYIFILGPILDSVIIMRNKDFRDVFTNAVRKQRVRPSYNSGRRPSVMLLLSATGERRGSIPKYVHQNGLSRNQTSVVHKNANYEVGLYHSSMINNGVETIVEEKSNSHTQVNIDNRVSMDYDSYYQYITEV